ncbi:hypothetical protein OH76DRAFT_900087 [Lentinus brumalis]|uniref:Uncharacterized protein n=1 Tax=Lentinus brumalis TaxID=2498619 RepID=A0A371D0P9_9APHY|nr:hypothetical protein OH76DRAFT_900087 [Polyporus brumalis]
MYVYEAPRTPFHCPRHLHCTHRKVQHHIIPETHRNVACPLPSPECTRCLSRQRCGRLGVPDWLLAALSEFKSSELRAQSSKFTPSTSTPTRPHPSLRSHHALRMRTRRARQFGTDQPRVARSGHTRLKLPAPRSGGSLPRSEFGLRLAIRRAPCQVCFRVRVLGMRAEGVNGRIAMTRRRAPLRYCGGSPVCKHAHTSGCIACIVPRIMCVTYHIHKVSQTYACITRVLCARSKFAVVHVHVHVCGAEALPVLYWGPCAIRLTALSVVECVVRLSTIGVWCRDSESDASLRSGISPHYPRMMSTIMPIHHRSQVLSVTAPPAALLLCTSDAIRMPVVATLAAPGKTASQTAVRCPSRSYYHETSYRTDSCSLQGLTMSEHTYARGAGADIAYLAPPDPPRDECMDAVSLTSRSPTRSQAPCRSAPTRPSSLFYSIHSVLTPS